MSGSLIIIAIFVIVIGGSLVFAFVFMQKRNKKALILSDFVTFIDEFKVLDDQFAKIQNEIKLGSAFSGASESDSLSLLQKYLITFEKRLNKMKAKIALFADQEVQSLALSKTKLYESFLSALNRLLTEKNMSEAYSDDVKLTISKMAHEIVDETEKLQGKALTARPRES